MQFPVYTHTHRGGALRVRHDQECCSDIPTRSVRKGSFTSRTSRMANELLTSTHHGDVSRSGNGAVRGKFHFVVRIIGSGTLLLLFWLPVEAQKMPQENPFQRETERKKERVRVCGVWRALRKWMYNMIANKRVGIAARARKLSDYFKNYIFIFYIVISISCPNMILWTCD